MQELKVKMSELTWCITTKSRAGTEMYHVIWAEGVEGFF